MKPSRSTFLAGVAGTAAAVSSPTLVAAADSAMVARATQGMTFTTLRDHGVDHVGIRTPSGIVDVARAARMLGVASPPLTVDDVVAAAATSPRSRTWSRTRRRRPCAIRATSSTVRSSVRRPRSYAWD